MYATMHLQKSKVARDLCLPILIRDKTKGLKTVGSRVDKNRLFECNFGRLRWLPTLFVLLLTRAPAASTQSLSRARLVWFGY